MDPLNGMCLTVSIFSGMQYLRYNKMNKDKREEYIFVALMNMFVFVYSAFYAICLKQMAVVNPNLHIETMDINVKVFLLPTLVVSILMMLHCLKQYKF